MRSKPPININNPLLSLPLSCVNSFCSSITASVSVILVTLTTEELGLPGEGRDLSCLSGKFMVYKRYPEHSAFGGNSSEPVLVLNKPCCSKSLSATCLFPTPRFLVYWPESQVNNQAVLQLLEYQRKPWPLTW